MAVMATVMMMVSTTIGIVPAVMTSMVAAIVVTVVVAVMSAAIPVPLSGGRLSARQGNDRKADRRDCERAGAIP